MDALKTLFERRTVHKYLPEPVPQDVVQKALEAAHQAPNHKLTFPWRFTVVGPEHRTRLADIALEVKRPESPAMEQAARAKITNPGLLVVVSQIRVEDSFRSKEDYAAVSCAIQNLLLALRAQGYGSKWSTGGVTRDSRTYRLLGIDEGREEIVGFVWGGLPEREPTAPKRPPLGDVIRQLP